MSEHTSKLEGSSIDDTGHLHTAPEDSSTLSGSSSDPDEMLIDLEGMVDEGDTDRWLARLVLDHKLATRDEVKKAIKKARGGLLSSKRPLGELLVQLQAVTPNQLSRIMREIDDERAGRTIPGFRMLGELGKGTSATVYRARQLNLDRVVAIKVLPPKSLGSKRIVEAFYEEGRAAAQLNHPNMVQAYDVGSHGEFLYFVMEYVEGRNVHELLRDRGPFTEREGLEFVLGIAQALEHAHSKGLVHRDVKPKNIIIAGGDPGAGGSELAKLADLGLARFISDEAARKRDLGRTLGTPYYISPEQVRGDADVGAPSDIYSLGATWHHMVTGHPLFNGTSAQEVMDQHLQAEPPRADSIDPSLDPGICDVLMKMIAKQPEDRYADCATLLTDLRAWKSVLVLKAGEQERGPDGPRP